MVPQLAEKLDLHRPQFPHVNIRICDMLMNFFASYPDIRFTKVSLFNAMNVGIEHGPVERAIDLLIDKGLVKSYSEDDVLFYGLNESTS